MSDQTRNLLIVLVGVAILWPMLDRVPANGGPSPTVAPVVDLPDMYSVFRQNKDGTAADDAFHIAAVARTQARVIRNQATQPADKRRVGKAGDVEDLRFATITVLPDAKSFAATYGQLWISTLEAFFNRRVGANDGPLTDVQYQQWAQAYDDFATACEQAGSKL